MNKSKYSHLTFLVVFGCLSVLLYSCQTDTVEIPETHPRDETYIDTEEAKEIARTIGMKMPHINAVFNGKSRQIESLNTKSWKPIKNINSILSSSQTENALYVVNYKHGGFAILSADKRTAPILAYSTSNNFPLDTILPIGVSEWITATILDIEKIRTENTPYNGQDSALNIFNWEELLMMNLLARQIVVSMNLSNRDRCWKRPGVREIVTTIFART